MVRISSVSPGPRSAGARAAHNTVVRTAGDVAARVASLILFAVMARELGQGGLGAFVFALAFVQIAMLPVGLGFDRYMLREVAGRPEQLGRLLYNILALKALLAIPFAAAAVVVVNVLGYGGQIRAVVYVLTGAIIVEVLTRTMLGVFETFERGSLIAVTLFVQRLAAAVLGITALAVGFGVIAVAVTYTVAALGALMLALVLMAKHVGFPSWRADPSTWRGLLRRSLPFGMTDVFGLVLFRVDMVMLSLMATSAAVGIYGAAYRLFESATVFTWALVGAFAPMFVYLGQTTEPTLTDVFSRALKAVLVVLTPAAVAFALLAEPLVRLFFGADFAQASGPLRMLAPVVVLIAVAAVTWSLLVSRGGAVTVMWMTAAMSVLNVALNLVLIPALGATGAALALLVTAVVFVALLAKLAIRIVGRPRWRSLVVAPAVAGAVMAVPMVLLEGLLVPSLVAGLVAYAIALVVVEWRVSPGELRAVAAFVRRRGVTRAG